jgi:Lipopolysaccharide kinase (Kdo/WaaP) family
MNSFWQRLWRGERRLRHTPDWEPAVGPGWAERIMDVAVTDRFHAKQGRSTGRWIIQGAQGRLAVYLKRHYRLPWWLRVRAFVWPGRGWSPAFQEWDHLEWARGEGLPVPRAVAAGETIGPWGRLQSFLAVEELADMLPLHLAIPLAASRLEASAFRRWKRSLAMELARLSRALHDQRRFHKDLYLCHFYILEQDIQTAPSAWQGRVHVIDLHRLGHHPYTWRLWQIKDIAQLLYSSDVAGVTVSDRVFFWRHYLGTGRRTWMEGWLRYWILFKARLYRAHKDRHRAPGSGHRAPQRAA